MSKFYIGQKIVAIKDHSQGIFEKGDEFTVLGIRNECCDNLVNIGLESLNEFTHTRCNCCNKRNPKKDRIWWINQIMFAPIELSSTTFEDVIKQYEPCLN